MAKRSLFFAFGFPSVLFFILISLPTLSSAESSHDHHRIGHDDHHGVNFMIITELIHRDSPKSPLYSPSLTPWKRLANALQRSHHRAIHFNRNILSSSNDNSAGESELFPSGGEYLMNISLGTPPTNILAIMDTGGDLTWTQCKPCRHCFKQKGPLFDPKISPTYKPLSCETKECKYLGKDSLCNKKSHLCDYNYTYADNSFTRGKLALETFTMFSSQGNPVSFPRTIFGCGFRNGGIFGGIESGIVGLGRGQLSLVSQMSSLINGKFSYCLVPTSSQSTHSSKLKFGSAGLPSGHGMVSTLLLSNGTDNYYYLLFEAVSIIHPKKEGISIEGKKFDIPLVSNYKDLYKGNIIIDTGTMFTYLPTELYNRLELEMRRAIHLPLTKDPNQISNLCYKTKSQDIGAPTVVFHFLGADVVLKTFNTYIQVSEDVLCLAFVPTDGLPIYGNVAQMDFLVQYDLKEQVLSFMPSDCTSY